MDEKLLSQIEDLLTQNKQLDAEANWLADYLCDIACHRDTKPCPEHISCRECWRAAAKEAVNSKK